MTRLALVSICLVSLIATCNGSAQSSEPDKAEVDVDKAMKSLIERIASLESQVAELKRERDISKAKAGGSDAAESSIEKGASRGRTQADALVGPRAVRQIDMFHLWPIDIQSNRETSEAIYQVRSRYSMRRSTQTPRRAPIPPATNHWQKLEINGKTYFVVPADELPASSAPADDSLRRPTEERRTE